jgi:CRISPR-associated protein Csb2
MLAISFSFPAKRFHATPWGRQVNEGAVEWPPSTWRILRSLVAVWHHKFPDVAEHDVRELINQLAPLPCFYLPSASQGHTRHYMPLVNGDKTKIFDTFIALKPNDHVLTIWNDVVLSDSQRELLAKLLDAMTYFGRAESWVIAELFNGVTNEANSTPLELGIEPESSFELIRTLVPALPEDHVIWHQGAREQQRQRKQEELVAAAISKGKPADKVKLSKKDEEMIDSGLPATLFDALQADTSELRKAGWNQPPGSRWVNYARPTAAFATTAGATQSQRPRDCKPTVARYAVCGTVRPLLTDALFLGDRVRAALMGRSKSLLGNAAPVFSGKTDNGEQLDDRHRHAHFLAEAPKADGRISHLNVLAMHEFSAQEEEVLGQFNQLWDREGYDLQFVLLGIGRPEDFGGLNDKAGQSRGLAESRQWVSRTPFVLSRHLKLKRTEMSDPELRDTAYRRALSDLLRFELRQRDQFAHLADTAEIEPILDREQAGTDLGGHFTSWLKFRRERTKGGGNRAGQSGYGFRLKFAEPVRGPIALGYGCHFGLGQFVPAE